MPNGKDFNERILEKIEKEKIRPEPKWRFLLKEYFIWGLAALALLVGGLANSILLFQLRNGDFDIYRHLNGRLLNFIIISIPYLWIILLALLIAAAIYNFKHTKRGYKYHPSYIIVGSILLSFFVGGIMFKAGVGRMLDENLEERSLFYARFIGGRHKPWLFPERGFLGGAIISVKDQANFTIRDFGNREWHIDAQEALIMEPLAIKVNNNVRMTGLIMERNIFKAWKVMPLGAGLNMPPPPASGKAPACGKNGACPLRR